MTQPQVSERWKDRRVLGACLEVAIVGFPIACAVGITLLMEEFVGRPAGVAPLVLWFVAVIGLSTVVYLAADRLARKALPLKVLLRMGLAFPGRPPRRLAVAWRAASVRDLGRRVAAAREHGIADEPTKAAEQIVTLAAAMSAHDRTTRGHSERVRALTDMIADELRLGTEDRDRLRWSALLHDIGKLAVHPDVLNKEGKLTDEEWEQIRRHPLEGARLTAPLAPWLGPWANTIAEHHERFDGKGYPHGIAGRDISLGGRIVSVADAYDVMTAARSYKAPIGPAAARQELTACAGSQFDPDIVRAFLGVSIWRLRVAAPLSWLGSLGVPRLSGGLAHAGAAAGGSIATGVLTAGAVVGLAILPPVGRPASPAPAGGQVAATAPAGTGAAPGTVAGGGGAGGGGAARGGGAPTAPASDGGGRGGAGGGVTTMGAPGTPDSSTTTTTPTGVTGSPSSTTSTTVPGGSPATTTTIAPGGTVPTTTTTLPGGGGTTTTTTTTSTTTTTTTTTTVPPPPSPPTNLTATSSCQVLVLGAEVTIAWVPSVTPSVTYDEILRSTNGSDYSTVTTVSPTTTSYVDTSVAGGRKYWYEVEAVAPGGTATSDKAFAATSPLCLL